MDSPNPHIGSCSCQLIDPPFEKDCSGRSRWRKVKTLASTESGVKVIHAANQRFQDGLGLPESFAVKKVPKVLLGVGPRAQHFHRMVQSAIATRDWGLTHVVTYYGAWQDNQNIYVVMEHCGSELHAAVACGLLPTDEHRREAAKQMLAAVGSLHNKGITVPDLRVQHFLLSSNGSIKLACLTPTSSAAPVSKGIEDAKKFDAFRLGVALFAIFFDKYPHGSIRPPPSSTPEASAKDLLARLMHPEPSLRLSVDRALAHPWLTPAVEPVVVADGNIRCSGELPWAATLALGGQ